MKNQLFIYISMVGLIGTLVSSCTWGKKGVTSTSSNSAVITKANPKEESKKSLKKETTKDNAAVTPEPVPVAKPGTDVYREPKSMETNSPMPSNEVERAFKSSFPTAKSVVWTKEKSLPNSFKVGEEGYKADFTIMDYKNSAIYSAEGQLLEAREHILPEQLPPAIYNAIQNKYPGCAILSATTVKYSVLKATYTALIRINPQAELKEVLLGENGTFLK